MKLDRNINANGMGKYALLNLRTNQVQWGNTPDDEFFVIKLKDIGALPALLAYAKLYKLVDPEYAAEIKALADRSGKHHKNADGVQSCKYAD